MVTQSTAATEPNLNDYLYSIRGHTPYSDVLPKVQGYMSSTFPDLFSKPELSHEDTFLIKRHSEQFLIDNAIECGECGTLSELVDRLYKDMVQWSFLTDYLQPAKIEELGLEEINVNSWECIYILTAKKGKILLPERFLSPQHAQDVIKRMLRHCGMTLDDAKPNALGDIAKNVRIACFQTPLLDEEAGVSCSIRVVSFSNLTRYNLVREYETIPARALDFLEACLWFGVSVCISGETGSGKTGTLGYLLSAVSQTAEKRIATLEEGSRELYLHRRDDSGRIINDVVHLKTRPSENDKQNIDQNALLEMLMRYHPNIIGIGEMRSKEAITAAEASGTGHPVITTTHAYSAPYTYDRLVELAQKASPASEEALYRKMVSAFPIVVYQEQLPDGSRKVREIIEGIRYADGIVEYRTLWRYNIEDNYEDTNGKVRVIGQFVEDEKISDRLRQRLIDKGMPRAIAEQY